MTFVILSIGFVIVSYETFMRFRHGELHLVLLALLGHRPMHGYELMSELSKRLGRRYSPSPGSIYPAVQSLESEGLISSLMDGDRRTYELTDVGREALNRRTDELAGVEARLRVRFSPDDDFDAAIARFVARIRVPAGVLLPPELEMVLDRAAVDIETWDRRNRR